MKTYVSVFKPLKHGTKIITGVLLRRGLSTVTLSVDDKNGSSSIKTFSEYKYKIVIHEAVNG